MILSALNIPAFLDAACDAGPWSLRSTDGNPVTKIDRETVNILAANEHICAVIRGKRVKWLELLVPPAVAFAERHNEQLRDLLHCEANDTFYRKRLARPGRRIFVHHAQRCSSFRPDHPAVSKCCVE